jgi:hypothetical protein
MENLESFLICPLGALNKYKNFEQFSENIMRVVFSVIKNNHTYGIWTKKEFNLSEIGGLKFHAATLIQKMKRIVLIMQSVIYGLIGWFMVTML